MMRAATFTAVVLACVGAARAQPVSTSVASIEWAADNSCLIVRAVIDDVSVHALKDGLYPNQGIHRYQTVSVRVLETLKGQHSDRRQFVEDGDFGAFRLSELQKNRQEVLLFLEPWIGSGKFSRSSGGYAYTRFPHVVKDVILLTPADSRWAHTSVAVLDSKLTRLSTSKQVTDTIKTDLKSRRQQGPVRGATTLLPPELRSGYYQVSFTYPVAADDATSKEPILEFDKFRERFAKQPPAEKKPPYLRNRGGYIGVYALELMAADCDAIVRGVIDDFCFVSRSDDPTGDSYGVKLRVIETVKGKAPEQITCLVSDARDLDELRRGRQELILFLRSNGSVPAPHPAGALEFRTRAGLWDDSAIVLSKESAEVLFADLTWHRDPDEIVARLRAAVKPTASRDKPDASQPVCALAAPPIFDVHPPASIAAGSSIAGNPYSIVYLPVTQELEATHASGLRRTIRICVGYRRGPWSTSNPTRMRRFSSGCFDDDATWERRDMLHMTGLSYPWEPEYLVRWEAWHVLAGWGYEVPRPDFSRSRRTDR
jgi:hypothetical protein